jgi:hypothetical protein
MTERTRAQTTLDFAIAMGIFLLAVSFVFTFIPSLTAPFVDGTQENSVVSDRVANHLAEGGLGDVNDPGVVAEPCLSAFFNSSNVSASDGCGFTGNTTSEHLGISDRFDVAVELVRVYPGNPADDRESTLCLTDGGVVSDYEQSSNCDIAYNQSTADQPPDGASVTVSRRTVTVASEDCAFADPSNGEACDATMYVRVW